MLDNKIKKIINELGIKVVYDERLEEEGHYIPLLNIIVINNRLSEFEQKKALLHELGHASKHKEEYALYKTTHTYLSKMEGEANDYAITQLIKEHDGIYNYGQLIDTFNVNMGWDTKYYRRS